MDTVGNTAVSFIHGGLCVGTAMPFPSRRCVAYSTCRRIYAIDRTSFNGPYQLEFHPLVWFHGYMFGIIYIYADAKNVIRCV